ncbi:MAG: flagellar protein FlbB [Treponema sp.]|nr:flagellar protein FlbB [Treponema sp.]
MGGKAVAGTGSIIGRIILLIVLILIIAGAGVLWFDYLNVIDAKNIINPVVSLLRNIPLLERILPAASARTSSNYDDDGLLNLDAERFAVRMEAVELRIMELERQENDLQTQYGQIQQMAQELEERQKALDERENSFNALLSDAEIKDRTVERNAINLTNMPPERAVGILAAMDDQDVIDVLTKTDELAESGGSASIVPYWLSLMDPQRAAELSRKMVARPSTLY